MSVADLHSENETVYCVFFNRLKILTHESHNDKSKLQLLERIHRPILLTSPSTLTVTTPSNMDYTNTSR